MSLICSVNVSGLASTTSCGSYPSCNACCTAIFSSCGGSNTHNCSQYNPGNQAGCQGDSCCQWIGAPASCMIKSCASFGSSSACSACGCTPAGSCSATSCGSLATTNLLACKGCDTCTGTATLSGTVDLRSYWSVDLKGKSPTVALQTTAATDSIIQDATHKLNFP